MPKLMSVAITAESVRRREKTVTRRLGWWTDKNGRRLLKAGDRLTLCLKVQGRKHDEPLVRLAEVEVVDVRREPLNHIYESDVAREGFPGWGRGRFIEFFCEHMDCDWDAEVTRIEWRYLDGAKEVDDGQ